MKIDLAKIDKIELKCIDCQTSTTLKIKDLEDYRTITCPKCDMGFDGAIEIFKTLATISRDNYRQFNLIFKKEKNKSKNIN